MSRDHASSVKCFTRFSRRKPSSSVLVFFFPCCFGLGVKHRRPDYRSDSTGLPRKSAGCLPTIDRGPSGRMATSTPCSYRFRVSVDAVSGWIPSSTPVVRSHRNHARDGGGMGRLSTLKCFTTSRVPLLSKTMVRKDLYRRELSCDTFIGWRSSSLGRGPIKL